MCRFNKKNMLHTCVIFCFQSFPVFNNFNFRQVKKDFQSQTESQKVDLHRNKILWVFPNIQLPACETFNVKYKINIWIVLYIVRKIRINVTIYPCMRNSQVSSIISKVCNLSRIHQSIEFKPSQIFLN